MDDKKALPAPADASLPQALAALRGAVAQLQSEDLHGVDSACLLADVVTLNTVTADKSTAPARSLKAYPSGAGPVAVAVAPQRFSQ